MYTKAQTSWSTLAQNLILEFHSRVFSYLRLVLLRFNKNLFRIVLELLGSCCFNFSIIFYSYMRNAFSSETSHNTTTNSHSCFVFLLWIASFLNASIFYRSLSIVLCCGCYSILKKFDQMYIRVWGTQCLLQPFQSFLTQFFLSWCVYKRTITIKILFDHYAIIF